MSSDIIFSWPNIDDDTVLFCTHVSAVALIWDLVGRSRETALAEGLHRRCHEANRARLWAFAQHALVALAERLKLAPAKHGGTSADGYQPLLQLVAALSRHACSRLLSADVIETFLRLPCISEAPRPRRFTHSQTIVYRVQAILRMLREAQSGKETATEVCTVVPGEGGILEGPSSSITANPGNTTSLSHVPVTSAALNDHHSLDQDISLGHRLGYKDLRTNPTMRSDGICPTITWKPR
ncbi:hypothetical protein BV20DRAFT_969577 [Pilatotrama ljubarskyi]|nr:hypothetical protein BV20DRAFT_969577 [Pilatotrama ljubarskyi]